MPIFRYKALTETGKKISGVIDADSLELAKDRLKREKILVTALSALEHKKEIFLRPSFLLAFTREMFQLLEAGLPLYESLLTVEEKYRRHPTHPVLLDLCDKLKGGEQFSHILQSHAKSFDPIYISLIQAGEKIGALAWSFEQLYLLTERRQKLKKQLISALAYPIFLGGFCLLVVMALLLFVVPSMIELFEGRMLHPLTQGVIFLSLFLRKWFWFILGALSTQILVVTLIFRRVSTRKRLQRFLYKIPILQTILSQAAWSRFCRSAALLLKGGIPLTSVLAIARRGMRHAILEEVIARAEKQLAEGKSLSGQFKKSSHVPPLVTRMLGIAEETGKLPEMLTSLSEIYDTELERSLIHVTTFIQPALLVVLGGVIGLVILSILLPLTDVSSLISSS